MKGLKGIALSIDTVVLVILAAVVVAVLLAFLMGTINPAKSEVDMLRVQNEACGEIASLDPRCGVRSGSFDPNSPVAKVVNDKLLSGNPNPCNVNRPSCTPGSGSDRVLSCLNTCCKIFCQVR